MKYTVITFGCRVNQADSIAVEEALRAAGAEAAPPEHADLVVVNTCSVTATADQGARQTIRRIARDNPEAQLVVTGCYATRRPDEVGALPNVLRVIPNDDKPRLLQLITKTTEHTEITEHLFVSASADGAVALTTAGRFGDGEGSCGAAIEPGVAGRTAYTLRVQTGCAEPCSYCIIPTTRGAPRSVPVADVLREVDRVTAAGFREIALTGVHLGSYGRDLTARSSLIELLRTLHSHHSAPFTRARESRLERELLERAGGGAQASGVIKDNPLFRISSLEPMDCSREIVDLVATADRFAPHFHLPLQHASNRVLAAMRRPYTVEYYASLVDDIRTRIPHASIGSDLIVGFPGETDEDFDELASYLERSPLTHLHVFPYSDRPGTVASTLRRRVQGAVIRERARRVREIGQRLTSAFRLSQVGSVHRALTLEDGTLAVTGNYLKVRIPPGRLRNEWVRVAVTAAGDPMSGQVTMT